MRVVKHWNRFPRGVVESSALEALETQLDKVLSNLLSLIYLWAEWDLNWTIWWGPFMPQLLLFCESFKLGQPERFEINPIIYKWSIKSIRTQVEPQSTLLARSFYSGIQDLCLSGVKYIQTDKCLQNRLQQFLLALYAKLPIDFLQTGISNCREAFDWKSHLKSFSISVEIC